jgi:hypothetical protein
MARVHTTALGRSTSGSLPKILARHERQTTWTPISAYESGSRLWNTRPSSRRIKTATDENGRLTGPGA